MKPYVGMIVHYQSYGTPGGEYPSVPRAAIITEVTEFGDFASLAILNPTGIFFNTRVPQTVTVEPTPGCWNVIPEWEES
jgi:hypothetical protein